VVVVTDDLSDTVENKVLLPELKSTTGKNWTRYSGV